ncbi:hypothetical protein M3J09_008378 [Ascochyta lentis]
MSGCMVAADNGDQATRLVSYSSVVLRRDG